MQDDDHMAAAAVKRMSAEDKDEDRRLQRVAALAQPLMRVDYLAYCVEETLSKEVPGMLDADAVLIRQLIPFWCARWTAKTTWWQRVKFWWRVMRRAAEERETF